MEITEVKVFPVRDKKLRAFVSIVLDGSFIVNDIKVISGKEGLFISMPSRRRKNGRFKDIAHPLNNETRQAMETRIIAEYERVTAEDGAEAPAPPQPAERPAAAAPSDPPAAAGEGGEEPAPEAPPPAADAAGEADAGGGEADAGGEAKAGGEADAGGDSPEDKSLEEVAEAHLSDSYWTT